MTEKVALVRGGSTLVRPVACDAECTGPEGRPVVQGEVMEREAWSGLRDGGDERAVGTIDGFGTFR